MSPNLKAFLDMLSFSEGTDRFGKNNGYDVLVGGGLFTDYTRHPNKLIDLGRGLKSTAAGRYQLLYRYWLAYCTLLKRSDFTPETQDLIAIQQIKERRALADIEAGRIRTAITKVKNIWASLPGAGYGQHENDLDRLLSAYLRFGGLLAQENV